MSATVLIVDDEKSFRVIAEEALSGEGYEVRTAESGTAGARAWREDPADVVILDRNLPDVDGVDLLATLSNEAQERGTDTLFLVATAYADVENAVQALRQGAEDYLTKPIQLSELLVKIRKALEARRLRNRVRALRRDRGAPIDALLSSQSPAMREVLERARKVAQSSSTSVLLQGESGTGKEVIARLIHDETPPRRDEAFVTLNCAAIAEGLLESELFGHERGAFTDAKSGKRGLLELAEGGTLFLDEIGELGLAMQTKLLRALETTAFRRVGGTRDLSVDVRIIAATNRNLEQEVAAGRFRLDLFHRLDVFHLTVPPLRQRREDIPQLAHWLLERIAHRLARVPPSLSPEGRARARRLRLSRQRARAAQRPRAGAHPRKRAADHAGLAGAGQDRARSRRRRARFLHRPAPGRQAADAGRDGEALRRAPSRARRREPHAGGAAARRLVSHGGEEDRRLRHQDSRVRPCWLRS